MTDAVENDPWTLRFARRLRQRWPHIPSEQLEEVAAELAADQVLHEAEPERAAELWLQRGAEAP